MAYKYLNDDGLKAYTKKVKGALKDLHTPIAISSENTTESKAQNVRNINDFVAKAKAAGIADVNGMAVTCLIDNNYSGVGYLYGDNYIQGVLIKDDLIDNMCFTVTSIGAYNEISLITSYSSGEVTSGMLDTGARKPIILTPDTTEVDEETYQKLISDDVDVMFKTNGDNYCVRTYKEAEGVYYFTALSVEDATLADTYLYGYRVSINDTAPHKVTVDQLYADIDIHSLIVNRGFINKPILSPVLQEIDLTGTDAERKTKLNQFEMDWKALTGANDMKGARFVGYMGTTSGELSTIFAWNSISSYYEGVGTDDVEKIYKIQVNPSAGNIHLTPLFSHLEPVEITPDNSAEFMKKNIENINAYKSNLEQLGVDTRKSFQVPFRVGDSASSFGTLQYTEDTNTYVGVCCVSDEDVVRILRISSTGESTFTEIPTDEDVQVVNTPVPLTTTTSTNKTQLNLFLSKVPNAQVMHCTYKDVYAGTLHKINGSWYGVLVGESNTLAGQLSIKLQADGTIVEGTA